MRYLLALILPIAVACSGGSDTGQAIQKPAATTTSATVTQVSGRAPAGALVLLEPTTAPVPLPSGPAMMDQFSKAFVPETLFVRVGQPVTFKNSEDQLHNVTVIRTRTGRTILNTSQNQGDVYSHTFDQAGEYDVMCDVHPGMRATIVATTTPHAAYANAQGAFAIANVTPGQYKLQVLADGRSTERVVDVSGTQLELGNVTKAP